MKKINSLLVFIFLSAFVLGFILTNEVLNKKHSLKTYKTSSGLLTMKLPSHFKKTEHVYNKNSTLELKDVENNIYFLIIEEDLALYKDFDDFKQVKIDEDKKDCPDIEVKDNILICKREVYSKNVLLKGKKYFQVLIWTDLKNINLDFNDIINNIGVVNEDN